MISKEVGIFGEKRLIGCDAKCEKAFGYNGRPSVQLSEDVDDICWLSDDEVGLAPVSGKTIITSEGEDMKPIPEIPTSLLNKWCFRECERCEIAEIGGVLKVKDFSQRQYNQQFKHGLVNS